MIIAIILTGFYLTGFYLTELTVCKPQEPPPTTKEIEAKKLLSGWHLIVKCDNERFRDYATKLGTRHGASPEGEGDKIEISLYCYDGDCLGCIWVSVEGMQTILGTTDGTFPNTSIRTRNRGLERIRDKLAKWIYDNYGDKKS